MGVLAASSYVAWLVVGLPAGALVARLPLRGTQVACDAARAVAVLSVPVVWWWGTLTLAHLVAVALVVSFADVFFFVANTTFLPSVVSRESLQARNSLMSGTHAATQLGGPSLGGLLVQVLGAAPALLADAVSYVVSAVLLRTLPDREVPRPQETATLRDQVREGWRFTTHHPVIGPCMWDATATNLVCGAQMALFPLYLVRVVGAPPGVVGVLLACEGVGSLLGAAACVRLVRAVGSARACLLLPLGTGGMAYACFAVGTAVFAAGVVVVSTTTRTYRQTATPPHLLSRVMATVRFVSWGAIPVGGLAAGLLAERVGARDALLVAGATFVLAPAVLVASPIRRMRDFPERP
jgi:predicted MFS family arabinose efflux permease